MLGLNPKDPPTPARPVEAEKPMNKTFGDSKLAPPAPAQTTNTTCVLGPTLHFKGELYGEEDLEFQGQLEGQIEHTRLSCQAARKIRRSSSLRYPAH